MEDVILNDADPSLQTLRRWGYDKRLFLLEQDEDLILGDVKYIPCLIELATDPECPKGQYALAIIKQYCRFVLEWRHRDLAESIAVIAESASTSPSSEVREWAIWFRQAFKAMV